MIVRLALWSLADSQTTVAELRRHLRDEAVGASSSVDGLGLTLWVSDEGTERWGFVSLLDSGDAAGQPLSDGTRELIGKPPDLVEEFDLEASVQGRSVLGDLSYLGLAFED